MENEIMNNEEIMETTTEEIAKAGSGNKGLAIVAGIGLVALVGAVAYKFGRPMIAKIKARKEKEGVIDAEVVAEEDVDEEDSKEE